jgi:3-deoxy-D-manno-octulosonic-acid transferase
LGSIIRSRVATQHKFLSGLDLSAALPAEAPLFPLVVSRLFPSALSREPGGVWIQGVSLGEVEVAITFAASLRRRRPALPILVTSSTPAGVGLLSRRLAQAGAAWRAFPLDLPFAVRRFFDAERPRLLVLVETELWPAVLNEARRRAVPVLLANARLSERSSARLRRASALFGGPLAAVTRVLARTPADAERFLAIGIPQGRVTVSGDLKFDRPAPDAPAFLPGARALAAGRPVLVAGSTAAGEIPLVLETRRLLASAAPVFLVLAPRQPDDFEVAARLCSEAGLRAVRRSLLGEADPGPADLLLLDTVGELAGTYLLADAALLGGTFVPKGGHNVLEPLRAGAPVVVGPSIENIRDAVEAAGSAVFRASDAASAASALAPLLAGGPARERARESARALFAAHAGAADRAADAALELLDGGAGA